jgi:hypothetical protein
MLTARHSKNAASIIYGAAVQNLEMPAAAVRVRKLMGPVPNSHENV